MRKNNAAPNGYMPMGAFKLANIVSTSISDFGKSISTKIQSVLPSGEGAPQTYDASPVDPIYYTQGYEDAKAGNYSRRPIIPGALVEYNRGRAAFQTGAAAPNGYMPGEAKAKAGFVRKVLPYAVGFAGVVFVAKKVFRR